MRLADDLPRLDPIEAARCWLPPDELLDLAGIWRAGSSSPERALFRNLVTRGFVAGRKSSSKRTAPFLYSFDSAVRTRVMVAVTRETISFDRAAEIADAALAETHGLLTRCADFRDLDTPQHTVSLIYSAGMGRAVATRLIDGWQLDLEQLDQFAPTTFGVVRLGPMLWHMAERYARLLRDAQETAP